MWVMATIRMVSHTVQLVQIIELIHENGHSMKIKCFKCK